MGDRTSTSIISEALELAGDTSLTLRATEWLKDWLNSVAAKYPWPTLQRRWGPLTLSAGGSLTIGAGLGTVAESLLRINKITMADGTEGSKWEPFILNPDELQPEDDPLWASTVNKGQPLKVLVTAGTTAGSWKLEFAPLSNKAYSVVVEANHKPSAAAATPWYPNDETMLHAVLTKALWHQEDPRYRDAEQLLTQKIHEDLFSRGRPAGYYSTLRLSKRFKKRQE